MKYYYPFKLTRIIDGDSVVGKVTLKSIKIDLGFGIDFRLLITKSIKVRLFGINAPEKRGRSKVAGLAAKEHLTELIKGEELTLRTIKPKRGEIDKTGKYGRWLGRLFVDDRKVSINDQMVTDGHAVYKEY